MAKITTRGTPGINGGGKAGGVGGAGKSGGGTKGPGGLPSKVPNAKSGVNRTNLPPRR